MDRSNKFFPWSENHDLDTEHRLKHLVDTPSSYDDGKYLKSTVSGTEWATISGAGWTTISGLEDALRGLIDGHYTELNNESSTTSTSFIQRIRLTVVPAFSGDYLINFSTMVSHEDTGVFCKLRLQINDSSTYKESWLELYNFKYEDGAYQIWSGSFAVPFTSGITYNIDLDYASGDKDKAMYLKETTLACQRLLTV